MFLHVTSKKFQPIGNSDSTQRQYNIDEISVKFSKENFKIADLQPAILIPWRNLTDISRLRRASYSCCGDGSKRANSDLPCQVSFHVIPRELDPTAATATALPLPTTACHCPATACYCPAAALLLPCYCSHCSVSHSRQCSSYRLACQRPSQPLSSQ